MLDPAISLLKDLVAIDSVNPSLVPGGAGEGEIAAFVAGHLRAAGLDVEVAPVAPGRPNVVGVLEGPSPGRDLMLCGHLDTVDEVLACRDALVELARVFCAPAFDRSGA